RASAPVPVAVDIGGGAQGRQARALAGAGGIDYEAHSRLPRPCAARPGPHTVSAGKAAMTDFATARRNMIEGQLRPNGVTDARVLRAFSDTPRELFVPASKRPVAYIDEDIEVGHG